MLWAWNEGGAIAVPLTASMGSVDGGGGTGDVSVKEVSAGEMFAAAVSVGEVSRIDPWAGVTVLSGPRLSGAAGESAPGKSVGTGASVAAGRGKGLASDVETVSATPVSPSSVAG